MREERIAKVSLALLLVAVTILLGTAVTGRVLRAQAGGNDKSKAKALFEGTKQNSLLNQMPDGTKMPESAKAKGDGATTSSSPGSNPIVPSTSGPVDSSDADAAISAPVRQSLLASLTIFVLAVVVGFELITKVPPTLHTPLMSGSNAISGITIVGAIFVAGVSVAEFASFVGFLAVVMATINCVGGFLVTHRMLAMFARPR